MTPAGISGAAIAMPRAAVETGAAASNPERR